MSSCKFTEAFRALSENGAKVSHTDFQAGLIFIVIDNRGPTIDQIQLLVTHLQEVGIPAEVDTKAVPGVGEAHRIQLLETETTH